MKWAVLMGAVVIALVFVLALRDQGGTYNASVAAIVHARCSSCHRPDGLGPFSLLTYEDAVAHASEIADVVESRYMPPWPPKLGHGEFQGVRRLSDEERATILAWIAAGAPKGSGTAPAPPAFAAAGFSNGKPDLVLEMSEPYVLAAEGADVYRNIVLPIAVDAPKFVKALELLPGNARVVHHAVIQVDETESTPAIDARDPEIGFDGMSMGGSKMPKGQLLIWTPGKSVVGTPHLTWRVNPGSYLVVQLHLQTTGRPEPVKASVGLYFSDEPPSDRAFVVELHAQDIDIAAGEEYEARRTTKMPADFDALAVYAHAHYLGKEIQAYATLPNGEKKWLLWIDDWDFSWQEEYQFVAPVHLPAGSEVVMVWRYKPPKTRVLFGEESKDEMASLWIHGVAKDPQGRVALEREKDRLAADELVLEMAAMAKADPTNTKRYLKYGRTLARIGRPEEAKQAYERAGTLDPFDRNMYAGVLRKLGRLDDAARELEKAIADNPNLAELHTNLGVTEMARGHREKAIAHYRRAIELRPQYALAHFNLGNAYAQGEDQKAAIEAFDRTLELMPDFEPALTNSAMALMRIDKKAEALARFQRAAALAPGSESAQENLRIALQTVETAKPPPRLGLRADDVQGGLQIVSVEPAGIAERNGLRAGDRVVAINGGPASRATLGDALQNGRPLELEIEREGTTVVVKIEL